jgi:hypothetical protein
MFKNIGQGLQISNINTIIKHYQKRWSEHLERMPENLIQKLFYQQKPKSRRYQACLAKMQKGVLFHVTGTGQELNL